MVHKLILGDIPVDVVFKDIKNVHLSVHPPAGRVQISAPARISLDTIRVFAISRLPWVRQQQKRLQGQEREARRDFVDRESHYVWGQRYLLEVVERERAPTVQLKGRRLVLTVRPATGKTEREAIVARWYRGLVNEAAADFMAKWKSVLGVHAEQTVVRRMKTKWGSCNPRRRTIRLNTELAKKPKDCLEYVVVHELVHLLEPTHNVRFVALMDQFLPSWKYCRQRLNRLPVRHADWDY